MGYFLFQNLVTLVGIKDETKIKKILIATTTTLYWLSVKRVHSQFNIFVQKLILCNDLCVYLIGIPNLKQTFSICLIWRSTWKIKSSFLKWTNPGLFFIYFRLLKHILQILQQVGIWKNVHPVFGAGIWTHNLWNMSLLP